MWKRPIRKPSHVKPDQADGDVSEESEAKKDELRHWQTTALAPAPAEIHDRLAKF
jgi:hypothetical protein